MATKTAPRYRAGSVLYSYGVRYVQVIDSKSPNSPFTIKSSGGQDNWVVDYLNGVEDGTITPTPLQADPWPGLDYRALLNRAVALR